MTSVAQRVISCDVRGRTCCSIEPICRRERVRACVYVCVCVCDLYLYELRLMFTQSDKRFHAYMFLGRPTTGE